MSKNAKHSHIILVATELFGQYGYHAVGVDWIIREAAISKKTLYSYFPSKENLIIEVLKKRDNDFFNSLNATLEGENDPIKKLELIFDWYNLWFNQKTFTGCMFVKAVNEFPSTKEVINKISILQKKNLFFRIENILNEIMDKAKAENIATIMIMLLDGAIISAQVLENKNAAKDAWEAMENIIKYF